MTLVPHSSTNTSLLRGLYTLQLISPSTSRFFVSFGVVSFGGTQTLFLSVQPSLRIARLIVEIETLSACFLSQKSWQCLSRVASIVLFELLPQGSPLLYALTD